jgi:hypothetical protein
MGTMFLSSLVETPLSIGTAYFFSWASIPISGQGSICIFDSFEFKQFQT